MLETLKIVGSLLGILAFGWKVWDIFSSYLYISVSVDVTNDEFISALTIVENKSPKVKSVDNAILLVGPESEDPIETFNRISEHSNLGITAKYTNDIVRKRLDGSAYGVNGRAVIPLPFYYSENVDIGDERLSYRAPIDLGEVEAGKPYSVRFFLWAHPRLHRSTQDCFITSPSSEYEKVGNKHHG